MTDDVRRNSGAKSDEPPPPSSRSGESRGKRRTSRPRMALRIPDDEVTRPSLTPSSSEVPHSERPSDGRSEPGLEDTTEIPTLTGVIVDDLMDDAGISRTRRMAKTLLDGGEFRAPAPSIPVITDPIPEPEPSERQLPTAEVVSIETPKPPSVARFSQPPPPPLSKDPRRPTPIASPSRLIVTPSIGGLGPAPLNETSTRRKARPWWEELFNEDFLRTAERMTPAQVAAEAVFIEESLGVAKNATILDLACGAGQQAVELAARGYHVVGFDLSLAMLARASEEAQDRNQKINFLQGDMRELPFENAFDGVYCWNTSFGFFEEEKNAAVIGHVHRSLRSGGQFLLDVANRDFVAAQSPSLVWFESDGCICMDEMQFDWITSRMRVKRTVMLDDGRTREIEYSIRLYSLHELGRVLHEHGFRVVEVSGQIQTPGVFLGNDSPRSLILAEKR